MRLAINSLVIYQESDRARFASAAVHLGNTSGHRSQRKAICRDCQEQLVKLVQHNVGKVVGKDVFDL